MNVCAACDEYVDDVEPPLNGSPHYGGLPILRKRVNVGTRLQKSAHALCVSVEREPVKWRAKTLVFYFNKVGRGADGFQKRLAVARTEGLKDRVNRDIHCMRYYGHDTNKVIANEIEIDAAFHWLVQHVHDSDTQHGLASPEWSPDLSFPGPLPGCCCCCSCIH